MTESGSGAVIKYERDNIDTDVIIPGQYLKIHDYAELEPCVDQYQNCSMAPAQPHYDLAASPQPYEVPMAVDVGSYVNVTSVPEPTNTCTNSKEDTINVTSLTLDHQYDTPGLPS